MASNELQAHVAFGGVRFTCKVITMSNYRSNLPAHQRLFIYDKWQWSFFSSQTLLGAP
jgi:hypothetical protein